MNLDSYKIIISLSHHRIAYDYWLRDGENRLFPCPGGDWPVPLAFYCKDSGIEIGEDAARAARSGNYNAFDNYFDLLPREKTYTIGGITKPLQELLLDASENVFQDFFRNKLLGRLGSLSANRARMPLTIVCEADIEPNERAFLKGLFLDNGYTRVNVVGYDQYIARHIRQTFTKEYDGEHVMVVWTEGADLTFTLFDMHGVRAPRRATYPGLGLDPRKEYVKNLIWERVIGQNPWLTRDREDAAVDKVAADFLSSDLPMVNGTVMLSDGKSYHYGLNRTAVDALRSNDGVDLRQKQEYFLRENGVADRSRVLMLLRGMVAGNSYFEQNLGQGFAKVIKTDRKLRDNTMRLIIADEHPIEEETVQISGVHTPPPVPQQYSVPTQPQPPVEPPVHRGPTIRMTPPPRVKADPKFEAFKDLDRFNNSRSYGNATSYGNHGFQEEMESTSPPPPPSPLKEKEMQWRQIKAEADGKQRAGQTMAAIQLMKDFQRGCEGVPGTEALRADIEDAIHGLLPHTAPTADSYTREWRQIKAAAQGKVRAGARLEAILMLKNFLRDYENTPGAHTLTSAIEEEIRRLEDAARIKMNKEPHEAQSQVVPTPTPSEKPSPTAAEAPSQTPSQEGKKRAPRGSKHYEGELHPNGKYYWDTTAAGGKGDWRVIGGWKQQRKAEQAMAATTNTEGERLVRGGDLKGARDWYRAQGDNNMSRMLNDIIRASRGIENRKSGLDECRRTKNRDQINRIISELDNYVTLCDRAGVDASDYRNLLQEYRKI